MCDEKSFVGKEDAAVMLAGILSSAVSPSTYFSAHDVRKLISTKWERIKVLAHKIHEEETSEARRLDEAVRNVATLGEYGIRNIINGTASADAVAAYKLVAKKIGNKDWNPGQ